jgi:hypothetical protein
MVKKKYSIFLIILLIIIPIYAEDSIGKRQDAQIGTTYYISQPCASCTYINITVFNKNGIILNNVPMSNNGTTWIYNFTPNESLRYDVNGIGDKDGENDSFAFWFDATLSGQQTNSSIIISDIIILIALIGLLLLIANKHQKTDFKEMNKKVLESQHMGQRFVKGFIYVLFKNSFIWVYFIGWVIIFILKDIIYRFNSADIYGYFTIISNIYSLGLLLVVVFMIGHFATYMRDSISVLTDKNWGIDE